MRKVKVKKSQADILARIICTRYWKHFKQFCVPRVFYFSWESDILVINDQRFAEEVEIKTTLSDFKQDFSTKIIKHNLLMKNNTILHKFWFAVPETLVDKVKDLIPPYAGLMSVSQTRYGKVTVVIDAPVLPKGKKFTTEEECRLLRSTYHRFWETY